jgi:predicted Kef-type K+ transport protein
MSLRHALKRRVMGCRICLPALLAAGIAAGGFGYGLVTDDTVTALGALLLVPSAVLLFGIGLRRESAALSGGQPRD